MRSRLRVLPRRRRRQAFTLVEVSFASVVLAIALSGMVGALVASTTLQRVNNETARAQQAARRALEELQGVPFQELFASYDGWAGNDAGLALGPRQASFAVPGLDPQDGDADGVCGVVVLPSVLNAGVSELREDVVDALLGMPRDLNGDGVVDALDHSADYVLLPVSVRVEWQGVSGNRVLAFETILCER